MSAVSVPMLEAARAACLAAMNSAQSALLTVEALIESHDETDAPDGDEPLETYETAPQPTNGARRNGRR